MTLYGTETTKDRIEQMIARGRPLAYITERLGVTEERVLEVGDRMDAALGQVDDPRVTYCRNGLHAVGPDTVYTAPNGSRACRPCKNDSSKASRKRAAA